MLRIMFLVKQYLKEVTSDIAISISLLRKKYSAKYQRYLYAETQYYKNLCTFPQHKLTDKLALAGSGALSSRQFEQSEISDFVHSTIHLKTIYWFAFFKRIEKGRKLYKRYILRQFI